MACRSGKLGQASASAMPPSSRPQSPRPRPTTLSLNKNRRNGERRGAGFSGVEGVFCDLLIAAIALANDLTLVTHNTREFSRVAGLRLEDWEAEDA